ncbi:unnamed protein product [Didymodactylos carnosus]|nr:unnamed protein product [Didymodactylos carnosus]CAF4247384.1 unnamed protein product [Didymodactylos carnosus]
MVLPIFVSTLCMVLMSTVFGDERCLSPNIQSQGSFPLKYGDSSIVAYGTVTSKSIYPTDQHLFNVTFQVDCVLKGEINERKINITQAGSAPNHNGCQYLDVGKQYIVFIQKFFNVYSPMDMEEIELRNDTTANIFEQYCDSADESLTLYYYTLKYEPNSVVDKCGILSASCNEKVKNSFISREYGVGFPFLTHQSIIIGGYSTETVTNNSIHHMVNNGIESFQHQPEHKGKSAIADDPKHGSAAFLHYHLSLVFTGVVYFLFLR